MTELAVDWKRARRWQQWGWLYVGHIWPCYSEFSI